MDQTEEPGKSTPPSPPKPKPAYKTADRATYFRDEVTGEKYYKCPYCFKHLKGHLSTHLRTHTGYKPWRCEECGKTFSQKCNLDTHIKSVHLTDKPFKCELCPKSYAYKKDLESHVATHLLENPYKCSYCSSRFSSVKLLRKHKRKMQHTENTLYDCVFCPQQFSEYFEMLCHLRKHIHERSFLCQFCDDSFFTSIQLRQHVRLCHLKIKYKGKLDPMTCIFCDQVLINQKKLFIHLRNHIGEDGSNYDVTAKKEYKCKEKICEKVLEFKKSSVRPRRRRDRKTTSMSATPCLPQQVSLNKRPYPCAFCERGFTEYSVLKHHLACHAKKWTDECPMCHERFFCNSLLKSHEINCKNEKRDEPHSCKVCGINYTTNEQLLNHFLWTHTGYEVVNLTRV